MKEALKSPKNSLHSSLVTLRTCVNYKLIKLPAKIPQLLFVCGGNKSKRIPSHRRKRLIDFTKGNIDNVHPFLAEKVFETLKIADPKRNLLQVEQSLFALADYIVIILESPGAFCELGAFSHESEYRKKIVVINDEKFKGTSSFINDGPLELIISENGEKNVLWYSMAKHEDQDLIADIFPGFSSIILEKHGKYGKTEERITFDGDDKRNLLFLRDLIIMLGPLSRTELEMIIEFIFQRNYNDTLHTLLAVLLSLNMIVLSSDASEYSSTDSSLFYRYELTSIKDVIAAFKTYNMKKKRS